MSGPLPGTAPQGPLLPAGSSRIVGIVNITEDSFSDGGRCLGPAAAVAHACNLRAEGADIIELGPLRNAISAGAACLNDIHGFGDPGLYPLLAASPCRLVVMHAVQAAGPATRVVTDPVAARDALTFLAAIIREASHA